MNCFFRPKDVIWWGLFDYIRQLEMDATPAPKDQSDLEQNIDHLLDDMIAATVTKTLYEPEFNKVWNIRSNFYHIFFSDTFMPTYEHYLIFKFLDEKKEKGSRWTTKYSFLQAYLKKNNEFSDSNQLMEYLRQCTTEPDALVFEQGERESYSYSVCDIWKAIFYIFDLADRYCSVILPRAQLIVWEAQIPFPKEEWYSGGHYNNKVRIIFDAIGHADQVQERCVHILILHSVVQFNQLLKQANELNNERRHHPRK